MRRPLRTSISKAVYHQSHCGTFARVFPATSIRGSFFRMKRLPLFRSFPCLLRLAFLGLLVNLPADYAVLWEHPSRFLEFASRQIDVLVYSFGLTWIIRLYSKYPHKTRYLWGR